MNKKKSDRPQIQETAAFNNHRNPSMSALSGKDFDTTERMHKTLEGYK